MSPHDITLKKTHPYKHSSPDTHGHFGLTPMRLEAYSAACVPFGWMLRRQVEGDQRSGDPGKARALKLGYDPARETDLPFETSWIQDRSNQLVMLDTFFGALRPETAWRAARAVGDHDINNFLLRADPTGPTPKLEPGMTVWIDEGSVALAH
jgi:hypothetical protein